jgi:cytochrome bd ubiquinol oxidase subunit I
VPGLNDFVLEDGTVKHPPVAPVFWAFRIMVGTGMLMLALSWFAAWQLWRRRGELPRLTLYAFVGMTFSGWIATIAGWYVTEIGRQPWLVSGVLTTAEAVTTTPAGTVLTSLVVYLLLYVALLAAYIGALYHLARKAGKPAPAAAPIAEGGEGLGVEALAAPTATPTR